MTFELDARTLTDWQACRRRYLLAVDWRPVRWRPKSLWTACLRRAVVQLSAGMAADAAASEARAEFLQAAANPGLDVYDGRNPYAAAKEWCVLFDTVLRAVGRLVLLTVQDAAPARLNGQFTWRVRAQTDDAGLLHRWIAVDTWDEDALSRELHGWPVMGDMAAVAAPMTLHVVVVGRERDGRRVSPWARAWRNPAMPGLRYRFKRTDASVPMWLADHPGESPDVWVEELSRTGLVDALIRHVPVDLPAERVLAETRGQMLREAIAMREAATDRGGVPWSAWPMSRGACDTWGPCVWQPCCYPTTQPDGLGLYQIRKADYSKTTTTTEAPCLT